MNTRHRLITMALVFFTPAMAIAAQPTRFVQDRFAIGFWVDPPADQITDARYAEIAEANFTLVIGGFGARTPETVARQLELCKRHGLKAIVSMANLEPAKLVTGPACWGYLVKDEPHLKDFSALKATVEAIRKARPGHLAYINLFPNVARPEQLGTDDYDDHVRQFINTVDVDVLSMDHYPVMKPGDDQRQYYCRNLESMRQASLTANIPFWNFFYTMPFSVRFDPTEAQIRWQIYTSLAYGAKGVLYFCYWTPKSNHFDKEGAIIMRNGTRTRHYDQAKRINQAIKNLGPTLMQLTSTGVYRVRPGDKIDEALAGCPIRKLTEGNYLIGTFQHADGRRAVLLNNYRFAYTAWPTVTFDVATSKVVEVCPKTGKETPVVDDSPSLEGLQISLDAGQGRLFLLSGR